MIVTPDSLGLHGRVDHAIGPGRAGLKRLLLKPEHAAGLLIEGDLWLAAGLRTKVLHRAIRAIDENRGMHFDLGDLDSIKWPGWPELKIASRRAPLIMPNGGTFFDYIRDQMLHHPSTRQVLNPGDASEVMKEGERWWRAGLPPMVFYRAAVAVNDARLARRTVLHLDAADLAGIDWSVGGRTSVGDDPQSAR